MYKIIIISVSSDIGQALAEHWVGRGHEVAGTFRTRTPALDALQEKGVDLVYCDLSDLTSVLAAGDALLERYKDWDIMVHAPGLQDPVGPFENSDFDTWQRSVEINFMAQMRLTHRLLPKRSMRTANGPMVMFFAGGGTNNATINYSAYTISKVALIKMCELLDAEVLDTRFTILGPGWVKTKIHDSTINAKSLAGDNFQKTLDKLASSDCVPMAKVVECCDWLISSERSIVGGRNFSLVYDEWGSYELEDSLRSDPNMYKLRRFGNDRLVRTTPISETTISQDKKCLN